MKPSDRQKMCPNCDGRIPFDATQCPYCFTMVPMESTPSYSTNKATSSQDPLSSLYPPAYSPKSPREEKRSASVSEQVASLPASEAQDEASSTAQFWPILALSLGGNLFTLGILQFFFSEQGVVHLELNSGYWFLLVVAAAPLFYFGFKKLSAKEG